MTRIKTELVSVIAKKSDIELYEAGLNPNEVTQNIQWGAEFKVVRAVSKLPKESRKKLNIYDDMVVSAEKMLGLVK